MVPQTKKQLVDRPARAGLPELAFGLLALAAMFNAGIPLGFMTVRLTEICAGLVVLVFLWRAGRGFEMPSRPGLPRLFWIVGGGYMIAAIVCAWGRGLGSARFEIEAMLAGAIALCWSRRISEGRLLGAVAAIVSLESVIALLLAAVGIRAMWFFAPGQSWQIIPMGEGGVESSGLMQLGGTLGHKNMLAAFFVLTLPVLAGGLLSQGVGRTLRLWALCALAAGLVALILTSALLGFAAVMFAIFLLSISWFVSRPLCWPRRQRTPAAAATGQTNGKTVGGARGFWVVAIVLCVLCLFAALKTRALAHAGNPGSWQARAYLWDEGKRLIEANPWLGIGRQDFSRFVDGGFPHAHDLYLMKFIESGVAGGALFAALAVVCVAAALRRVFVPGYLHEPSRVIAGLCAGFVAFALYAMTDYFYNEPPLAALFWVAAGIALGPREREYRISNKECRSETRGECRETTAKNGC